jgi:hypothetical protein
VLSTGLEFLSMVCFDKLIIKICLFSERYFHDFKTKILALGVFALKSSF